MKKPVYSRCIAVTTRCAAFKETLLTILFTLIMVLLGKQLSAQASYMQVSPTRLVFEGEKRLQELTLTNNGKDTLRYNLTLIEMKMNEDGKLEQITAPDTGQFFASKYVTIYPDRIELAPGASDAVKVLVSRTVEMPTGEYRSHLHFEATGAVVAPATIASGGSSVTLKPVRTINVPVIVREGMADVRVTISDVGFAVRNDTPMCRVTVNRLGNRSVYGDLLVNFTDKSGQTLTVGEMKNVAIYTPNAYRKFEVKLKNIPGLNYKEGKFNVAYNDATTNTAQKNFVLH